MEHQVIDNLKDIFYQFDKYASVIFYPMNNYIRIEYRPRMLSYINNLGVLNTFLDKKIYKYQNNYWKFSTLKNVVINNGLLETIIYIESIIPTTYFELLPKELINLIVMYLENESINNFCFYIETWDHLCNEDFYRTSYILKFPQFYELIERYLKYEDETWYQRYRSLLFQEVDNIYQLSSMYEGIIPRNQHIHFILLIHDIVFKFKYKTIEYLYQNYKDLLISIIDNMNNINRERIYNLLISKNRLEILNAFRSH